MAGAITVLTTPAAHAGPQVFSSVVAPSADRPLTGKELRQLERELELLFTVYLGRDAVGAWHVDEAAASGSGIDLGVLRKLAENLNRAEPFLERWAPSQRGARDASGVTPQHAFGSDAYGRCVLDFTGFGALFGTATGAGSGFMAYLGAKRWADAALVLARFVGTRALLGGVAGLAASLAAAAAWCATPWAR